MKAALFTELDCAARQIRDPYKVAAQTHGIYDPDGCFNTLGKIKRLVCSDAQKLTEDNARFSKKCLDSFRSRRFRKTFKRHSSMAFLHSFTLPDFLDSLVSLFAAFVLGTAIGAERQYRQRGGGLRTHVLVSVGAATFVDIGMHLNGNPGATQIIAYVVSGVGFLGAGVIMKQGSSVWGLNTAATLWCSAAVGACAGADLAFEAIALTAFVLAGNTLLRPLVNAINRAPIEEGATEAIYEVRVTTKIENLDEVRELLRDQLEAAHYPPKDIEAVEREHGDVELVAVLVGSSADPNELDGVVSRLDAHALVETASWDFRTTE